LWLGKETFCEQPRFPLVGGLEVICAFAPL
jgi:hypothetical protein